MNRPEHAPTNIPEQEMFLHDFLKSHTPIFEVDLGKTTTVFHVQSAKTIRYLLISLLLSLLPFLWCCPPTISQVSRIQCTTRSEDKSMSARADAATSDKGKARFWKKFASLRPKDLPILGRHATGKEKRPASKERLV